MIDMNGRRIVIIGGGMGIGLAAVEILLQQGARIWVADIDPAAEARLKALSPRIGFATVDATSPAGVNNLLKAAESDMGGIDSLFTTIGGAALGPLADMELDAWEREIRFNLGSAYAVGRTALPYLRRAEGGSIVFTSSGYALLAGEDRVAYTAAKAGVIAFARSLAMIAAADGTRVNCIAPGPTDTPRFRAMNGGDAGVEKVRAKMPLGKIPTAADSARLAIFLLSDAAAAITGQTIHVSGGLLMP